MFLQSRSTLRAVCVVLTLVVLSGCTQLAPTVQGPATVAPIATATTATSAPATAAPATDAPATTAPATTVPATDALATTVPATAAPAGVPAPSFGPSWGDRSIYEGGLIASERKVLAALPGASEYRIDLRIDDSLTAVTGVQQVRYTNREDVPLSEIYVRLFPNALGGKMTVSDVTVDGAGMTPEYRFEDTAVRIALQQPLPVGGSTVVGLKYQIEVPTSLDKGYGLISFTSDILALDTPYAPIPVYNQEGWNVETPPENADTSFNDVSFYVVRITAPERLKLVVTGVEVERKTEGGAQVVTYEQGPARDFFVAGSPDYVVTTACAGETTINSYALPGEEEGAQTTLDAAVKGIEIYGKRFGAYPYTEFDVAATPMLALGIEYPGTVGISERIYRADYRPAVGPPLLTQQSTLAHELAHQWFYNLVGNDQIDQPWLDEAMAQYSTCLYFLDAKGQQAARTCQDNWEARWDRVQREQKPVGLPASEYDVREYSAIVYGRGPLFVAALAERMGTEKFDQFLKNYAERFRWGIATTNDFEQMASQACGCDLADVYREWLEP